MTFVEPVAVAVTDEPTSTIEWKPALVGALVAAALAFVLHAFAAAIGLAVSSSAPTWRELCQQSCKCCPGFILCWWLSSPSASAAIWPVVYASR